MLKLVSALDVGFESVLEYYNSFSSDKEVNSFTICSIVDGKDKYFELVACSFETLYYLNDDERPGYIIGYGNIDKSGLHDYHDDSINDGNISYGVRVCERRKGYGSLILKLLMNKCLEFGMSEVCVSCLKENIASNGVIKNNGGILERSFMTAFGKPALKYWIKLGDSPVEEVVWGKKSI